MLRCVFILLLIVLGSESQVMSNTRPFASSQKEQNPENIQNSCGMPLRSRKKRPIWHI